MFKRALERKFLGGAPKCELLIVQGSPFCNIRCSYCYLPDRGNRERMSEQTLRATFKNFFSSQFAGSEVTVVWHAGEPLALPIHFYEKAFAIAESCNLKKVKINHNFQTNGTTLNDKWCEFIKKHNVSVGVSIDGPQHLHDFNRVTHKGLGTFKKAMRGIGFLNKHQIPFSTISVLTKASLQQSESMFNFFLDLGAMTIGLNPEEQEGINLQSSLESSAIEEVTGFYQNIMRLNAEKDDPLKFRDLQTRDDIFDRNGKFNDSFKNKKHLGNSENRPFRIISVGVKGDFSTFSPELIGQDMPKHNNFIFGNVHKDRFEDMIYSSHFLKAYKEITEGIYRCANQCEKFYQCQGGAPSEKIAEHGTFNVAETLSCRTKTIPSKVAKDFKQKKLQELG